MAQARAGNIEGGLTVLTKALDTVAETGERY
jgi:hypothetical protein